MAAGCPNIPIVFAKTRPLVEEWTYRYLAAAQIWATTGPADLAFGQSVGGQRRAHPVLFEDLGEAVLDDHRGAGQGSEFAQGVAQFAAGEAGDQVGPRRAFHLG